MKEYHKAFARIATKDIELEMQNIQGRRRQMKTGFFWLHCVTCITCPGMPSFRQALEAYDKGLALDKSNEECKKGKEQVPHGSTW